MSFNYLFQYKNRSSTWTLYVESGKAAVPTERSPAVGFKVVYTRIAVFFFSYYSFRTKNLKKKKNQDFSGKKKL